MSLPTRQFTDFQEAEAQGAIKLATTVEDLARALGLPPIRLAQTLASVPRGHPDDFGRSFPTAPLAPPCCGVKVTGALFRTQGGLITDDRARALNPGGASFPNLYADGGAACGVSGMADTGYLSGNGLPAAVVPGWRAGVAGA